MLRYIRSGMYLFSFIRETTPKPVNFLIRHLLQQIFLVIWPYWMKQRCSVALEKLIR